MSDAFTMFDPQATIHATYAEQRAMLQLDTERQRAKTASTARLTGTKADKVKRERTYTGWMKPTDLTKRILPAATYTPWNAAFTRCAKYWRTIPLDSLRNLVAVQRDGLADLLGMTEQMMAMDSCTVRYGDQELALAFKNVQSALRQLETACSPTSKRQAVRSLVTLAAVVALSDDVATHGQDAPSTRYTFTYA